MRDIKVYNAFFPIFLLFFIPPVIYVSLVVNFIIDSVVVLWTIRRIRPELMMKAYKKSIVKVWLYGFLADILGTVVLVPFITINIGSDYFFKIQNAIVMNPFSNVVAFIVVCLAVCVAGRFIYFFNKRVFRKSDLTKDEQRLVARNVAIFTAPYLFLMPLELLIF